MAPDRPEVVALLADCKEHPDDDTPRLVLADWLEERDDARGSFLRAQVEAARRPEGDPERARLEAEAAGLLLRHEAAWLGRLRPHLLGWEFARGLVHVRALAKELRGAAGRDIGRETLAWVEGFRLFDAGPHLPHLAGAGLLDGARVLDLKYNRVGDAALRSWLAAAPLPLVQDLDLFANQLGPASAQALAATEALPALRRLNVGGNPLGDAGLYELTWPRHFRHLETLQLERTGLRQVAPVLRPRAIRAPDLRRLDVHDNDLDAAALTTLLCYLPIPPLTRLSLRSPRLGDIDAALVFATAGSRVARLEWLSLPGCGLIDQAAEALADAPSLTRLRMLILDGNQLTRRGVLALLHSPHLVGLRELSLQDMQFDAHADRDALLAAPRLAQLDYLGSASLRLDSSTGAELRRRYPALLVV